MGGWRQIGGSWETMGQELGSKGWEVGDEGWELGDEVIGTWRRGMGEKQFKEMGVGRIRDGRHYDRR